MTMDRDVSLDPDGHASQAGESANPGQMTLQALEFWPTWHAVERIRNLTDDEYHRLLLAAYRRFGRQSGRDFLHTAFERVLSGSRRWPQSLPFLHFMYGVIKSLAEAEFRPSRADLLKYAEELTTLTDGDIAQHVSSSSEGPYSQAASRIGWGKVFYLFAGKPAELGYIKARILGLTPAEAQVRYKLTETEYDSARRQVARAIHSAFPDGVI